MIPYLTKRTEFEIQSDAYQYLRERGLNVRGEITERINIRKLSRGIKGMRQCRFDIVVYDSFNKAVCIIEVKDASEKSQPNLRKNRQFRKYSLYKLPLLYCWEETAPKDLYNNFISLKKEFLSLYQNHHQDDFKS